MNKTNVHTDVKAKRQSAAEHTSAGGIPLLKASVFAPGSGLFTACLYSDFEPKILKLVYICVPGSKE